MTEYREGNHNEFIRYLYSNNPKEKGEIKLESSYIEPGKNLGLHIFEQLLMILVDGLKYFNGDENDKVTISEITKNDIEKINKYFISMNYSVNLDIYPTINEYKFKFPNYFKDQNKITINTKLEDFYYEIYDSKNCTYRISFNNF